MFWLATGIIIGAIIGINSSYIIPIEYIKYTAVISVAIIDVLSSVLKSELTTHKTRPQKMFLELAFNILLAIGITYLGEKLGLDLYLAATFVFIFRIFGNFGILQQNILKK